MLTKVRGLPFKSMEFANTNAHSSSRSRPEPKALLSTPSGASIAYSGPTTLSDANVAAGHGSSSRFIPPLSSYGTIAWEH